MAARYTTPLAFGTLLVAAWYNWWTWRRTALPRRPGGAQSAGIQSWPHTPKVSVLVAAWNEADTIERHIQSFERLDYPAKQLILAAGGPDGTYEIASKHADGEIIVLRQHPGEGKQRCLEHCLEASDGEIIMLTDGDCVFADLAFRQLIEPIVLGEAGATTGHREPFREARNQAFVRFQWLIEAASTDARRHANGMWGGNCAFRRDLIERSGALRMPVATGTDYVQGRRLLSAGYRIKWVPESLVETRYPIDAAIYLRTWRRWIKNILIHGPGFGDWRGVSHTLVAIGLAATTLFMPLAMPVAGRGALAVPLTSLGVASLNRFRRVAVGARATGSREPWWLYAASPLFALLDQVAAVLAAVDTLSRKGRDRW